ncbi:MAG: D-aminoacyl-tRNA deacylase [Candidatus Dormibacteraeota bacterium]|nr:D-aminoacyl-tRNA deacylase [Candidatus Dormibacteraeota bacterium]
MRAVVQRVTRASVRVDGEVVGAVARGLLVLLGVGPGDTPAVAERLAGRVAMLRVFADDAGRMNLDLLQVGGAVLVVSQFTLFGDASRGHRPSFIGAGPPELGRHLCDVFADAMRRRGLEVATGRFGAHMDVDLTNDGPVTLVLSSAEGGWSTDAG